MASFELKLTSASDLDTHLSGSSYLSGYLPSCLDASLSKSLKLPQSELSKYPNLNRWFKHLQTFPDSEIKSFDKVDSNSVNIAGLSVVGPDSNKMKDPEKSKGKPSAAAGKGKKGVAEVSYDALCFQLHFICCYVIFL